MQLKSLPGLLAPGILGLVCLLATTSDAQEGKDEVAAVVGDNKIYVSQVDHEFQKKFAERNVGDELKAGLRYQILQRLCQQQLILERLSGSEVYATDDEVKLEISRLRERLQKIEKTLETYLAENRQSLAGLEFNYRWQISWKRYLDRTLTDEILEKYFNRHRRQFDGTQVRVAHILFDLPKEDPESAKVVIDQANQVRQEIIDGKVSWNQAVQANSTAPSATQAGDVGWIQYSGPMSRSFTTLAFRLEVDQISQPVQTPFGIHVIKCTEIRPGTTPWYDVKAEIKRVATQELFRRVADKQKPQTEVRLTGVVAAAPDPSESDR